MRGLFPLFKLPDLDEDRIIKLIIDEKDQFIGFVMFGPKTMISSHGEDFGNMVQQIAYKESVLEINQLGVIAGKEKYKEELLNHVIIYVESKKDIEKIIASTTDTKFFKNFGFKFSNQFDDGKMELCLKQSNGNGN